MVDAAEIEQQLSPRIAALVRSVRFADGVATLVADASGLGRAAAAELQRTLEQEVGAIEGVSEVRVALMADKVQRKIVVIGSGKGGVGKSTLTANSRSRWPARGARSGWSTPISTARRSRCCSTLRTPSRPPKANNWSR